MSDLLVSVMLLLAVTSGAPRSAAAAALSDAAIEAQCRPYFHDACSEAMGRWLPGGLGNLDSKDATQVARGDDFRYEGHGPQRRTLDFQGPVDGTFFVFGSAGPPQGHAVYDYAHRIAFYAVGCCTWQSVTEIADAPSPPKHLVGRDLLSLSTKRGIRLWQTEAEVMRIYGKSTPSPEAKHPDVRVFSYAFQFLAQKNRCEQTQTFSFRDHRLIEIQLTNAC